MVAAVCLTLSLAHWAAWFRQRGRIDHLIYAVMATAAAESVIYELLRMKATDPFMYGLWLRWAHLPLVAYIFSILAFVRSYLRAGRVWLLWLVVGLRGFASLVLNFSTGVNLHYRSILEDVSNG